MMQDIPPPPPGFTIVGGGVPPPPPGFRPVAASPARQPRAAPARPRPAGQPAPMTASAPLNDLGITDADERASLIAQGGAEWADEQMALDPYAGPVMPEPAASLDAPPPADNWSGLSYTSDSPVRQSPGFEMQSGGPQYQYDWNLLSDAERQSLPKGARVLMPQNDGETFRQIVTLNADADAADRGLLPGDETQMFGGVRGLIGSPADAVGAVASGALEQTGIGDEGVTALDALINRRPFTESRDAYRMMQDRLNQTDRTGRNVGGLAGAGAMMFAPGVGQAGSFIRGGGTGLGQTARAALVGGGAGAYFGATSSDGGAQDRLGGMARGAGVGAGTAGLLDAGGQRLIEGALARFAAGPSPQRRLSRQGVDLTPGQAAGGALQRVEDGLTSVPILGDAIRGAQRRGLGTFDNVATNTAIEPIGVNLADTAGRQGVRAADDAISAAYTRALTGTTFDLDAPAVAALTRARRPERLTPDLRRDLNAVLDNALERLQSGPVSGDVWKQVDSELAAASRAAGRGAANNPAQRILRDRLDEAREAVGGAMERADPMAFADARAADRASAQYRLVRKASSDVASAGRGGDASPATLNRAVVAAGGERQAARGESLLQDLTDDAMQVLPRTVPDSGTPLRGLLSVGSLGGGAAVIGADPFAVGAGIAGLGLLSTAYGPTGQRIFNAIYRSTDRQTATSALGELQRLASQNPALQGQYEAAARHVLEFFESPSPEQAPTATGLLSPTSR